MVEDGWGGLLLEILDGLLEDEPAHADALQLAGVARLLFTDGASGAPLTMERICSSGLDDAYGRLLAEVRRLLVQIAGYVRSPSTAPAPDDLRMLHLGTAELAYALALPAWRDEKAADASYAAIVLTFALENDPIESAEVLLQALPFITGPCEKLLLRTQGCTHTVSMTPLDVTPDGAWTTADGAELPPHTWVFSEDDVQAIVRNLPEDLAPLAEGIAEAVDPSALGRSAYAVPPALIAELDARALWLRIAWDFADAMKLAEEMLENQS